MESNRYVITGGDFEKKKVKKFGKSGGHIYLPKEWIGCEVLVVKNGNVERKESE